VIKDDDRQITVIDGQPTVSLNQTPGFVPTEQGSLPYFHVDAPLADALARVTRAGGRVVEPGTPRGDNGVFSLVTDTEGNALYLHASSQSRHRTSCGPGQERTGVGRCETLHRCPSTRSVTSNPTSIPTPTSTRTPW